MLTNEDLERVRQLIYRETGMLFEEKKNYLLTNRIVERMRQKGLKHFRDYYASLHERASQELTTFIESITINETYFFRDFPQLQGFAENVLSRYLSKKIAKGDRSLRIWSAACSTGEEAYTLSIILQEVILDIGRWDISIDATDIDSQVLAIAREAVYAERSLQDTPSVYRSKYFDKVPEGWRVNEAGRRFVSFKQLNLIDKFGMRKMQDYDFIFCRNVLIYFDDDSRRKVVTQLYDALRPEGYVFLGHSESVGRITSAFEMEKIEGFLCHKKPA